MKKVLIAFDPQEISTAQLAAIRALVPEDDLLITSDAAQIEAIQHEVEIATGRLSPAAFIPNAPNLH